MEYQNAMEKLIKCIPVFMILTLGFVMRCELFHTTLMDSVFASYPAIYCNIKENEFVPLMESLGQDAKVSNESCFFISWENDSRLEHKLTIFTDDENVRIDLKENNNITEGVYESLLSGSTEIVFLPLEDYSYDNLMTNPYLCIIGTTDTEVSLYETLKSEYDVAYPQVLQSDESDMIIIVWLMIAIFIILINGSTVLRRKKEMLIRAIYGEDIVRITIKSVVEDLVIYELLYFLAKLFVSRFISGDYKSGLAFLIFEVGCFISVTLNLLYLKPDAKAVFSNVTDNRGTLILLYVLKAFAFAMAVFTLTTNFSSLKKAVLSNESDKFYSFYNDDIFLSISDEEWGTNSDDRTNAEKNIWKMLYNEYYDTVRPVISINIADVKNPVILINEFAASLLPESLDMTDAGGEDIIVMYPEDWKVSSEDINGLLGLYLQNPKNNKWKGMEYEAHIRVPYVSTDQLTGFSEAADPVIIYCGGNVRLNSSVFANSQDVIYDITSDNLDSLDKNLGISEQGFRLIPTNMGEVYKYQMSFVMRLVRFLSLLCILVLLLDLAITVTLCNMEYRIFGMEYAIKKVLGYSLVGRNKRQFLKSNAVNIIFTILFAMLGILTGIYNPITCLLTGVAVIVVENVVMLYCVLKMERLSVKKILKGGCL